MRVFYYQQQPLLKQVIVVCITLSDFCSASQSRVFHRFIWWKIMYPHRRVKLHTRTSSIKSERLKVNERIHLRIEMICCEAGGMTEWVLSEIKATVETLDGVARNSTPRDNGLICTIFSDSDARRARWRVVPVFIRDPVEARRITAAARRIDPVDIICRFYVMSPFVQLSVANVRGFIELRAFGTHLASALTHAAIHRQARQVVAYRSLMCGRS